MSEHEHETPEGETPDEHAPAETPEPDEDEAAEDEEVPPEPEPEPQPQGFTPEEYEKRAKKAETALKAYTSKLETIFEEQALDLIPCPLCSFTDHPAFVNQHAEGQVPDNVVKLALKFLGRAPAIEYKPDPEHRACPTCDAEGKVATGSKVPGKGELPCPSCKGGGFVPPLGTAAALPAVGEVPDHIASGNGATDQLGDADEWNEPRLLPDGRENPNFGRMPHRKILVEPWGVTAGLIAQDA